jgi:uncharacterized protein YcfJ
MKSHIKALVAALGVVAVMPLAYTYPYDEYAPVTHVTPHVTTVNEPQQVCHTETIPLQHEHRWFRGDDVTFQQIEKCQTVDHYATRTNGYSVTYVYHGRSYTTEMPYDPGERVHITVDVQPS